MLFYFGNTQPNPQPGAPAGFVAPTVWIEGAGLPSRTYLSSTTARTPYDGTGAPWANAATTPYSLSSNDTTGADFGPVASVPQDVYGGGGLLGAPRLQYRSYPNVQETFGIQYRATSMALRAKLTSHLRQALSGALTKRPPTLCIQLPGSTEVVAFEIYSATVQENALSIGKEARSNLFRATITWTLSFAGSTFEAGIGTIPSLTMRNSASGDAVGANTNVRMFDVDTGLSPSGDLVYEGQPLNVRVSPAASNVALANLYVATVKARRTSTVGAGQLSTNGQAAIHTIDAALLASERGVRVRVLADVSPLSGADCRMRAVAALDDTRIWEGAWRQTGAVGSLLDFGGFDASMIRPAREWSFPELNVQIERDSDAGTVYLNSATTLLYYDFVTIYPQNFTPSAGAGIVLDSYQDAPTWACLPHQYSQAIQLDASGRGATIPAVGRFPRYVADAGLFVGWNTVEGYPNGATATVDADYAPLWLTLHS